MAATTSQGKTFSLFMVGLTAAAAGVAFVGTGTGKVALVAGLGLLAASAVSFIRIKPSEGNVPDLKQPTVLKLVGIALALAGWLVVLFGLKVSPSVSARMITTLIGLAVSLTGVLGVLPIAANKNAIWKA